MRRILSFLIVGILLVPTIARQVSSQNGPNTDDETKKEVLKFEDERNQAILN
jgi:hypothetical protein